MLKSKTAAKKPEMERKLEINQTRYLKNALIFKKSKNGFVK